MISKDKNLTFLEYSPSGPSVFHQVTLQEQFRPDIISYKYYKSPRFWQEIMLTNGIINIFDIEAGMVLKIMKQPQQVTVSERVEI
jgi:hypothetical protein